MVPSAQGALCFLQHFVCVGAETRNEVSGHSSPLTSHQASVAWVILISKEAAFPGRDLKPMAFSTVAEVFAA